MTRIRIKGNQDQAFPKLATASGVQSIGRTKAIFLKAHSSPCRPFKSISSKSFRTYHASEIALYHTLGALPAPSKIVVFI